MAGRAPNRTRGSVCRPIGRENSGSEVAVPDEQSSEDHPFGTLEEAIAAGHLDSDGHTKPVPERPLNLLLDEFSESLFNFTFFVLYANAPGCPDTPLKKLRSPGDRRRLEACRNHYRDNVNGWRNEMLRKFDQLSDECPTPYKTNALLLKSELREWSGRLLFRLYPDELPVLREQFRPKPVVVPWARLSSCLYRAKVLGRVHDLASAVLRHPGEPAISAEDTERALVRTASEHAQQPILPFAALRDPGEATPNGNEIERTILQTVSGHGKRLTGELIAQKAPLTFGPNLRTILAGLVRQGKLDNRQDVRPRGYGLPEWSHPQKP